MIRKAEIGELGNLHACAREFYESSRHLGRFDLGRFCALWEKLLSNGTGIIFVDERDGELVGTIGGMVHEDLYDPRLIATELFWFARKEHRGAGLKLYREFERWAGENGAAMIRMAHLLDSMPEKVSHFYQRAGYTAIETYYGKSLR